MQTSLASKLTVMASGLVLVSCLVVGGMFTWAHEQLLRQSAHKAVEREVVDLEDRLQKNMQDMKAQAFEVISQSKKLLSTGMQKTEQSELAWYLGMSELFEKIPHLEQVQWIDLSDRQVIYELSARNVEDIHKMQQMEEGRKALKHPAIGMFESYLYSSDHLPHLDKKRKGLQFSTPRLKRDRKHQLDERRISVIQAIEEQAGILIVVNFDWRPFVRASSKHFQDLGLELYITTQKGDYLVHPDPIRTFGFELGVKARIQQDFLPTIDFIGGKAKRDIITTGPMRGDHALAISKLELQNILGGEHLLVALKGSSKNFKLDVENSKRQGLIIIAILVLVVAMITYSSARAMTGNLKKITRAANDFATGKSQVDIFINTRDEIGILAKSFAHMVHQINERTKRLTRSEETSRRSKEYAEEMSKTKTLLLRNLRKQKSDLEKMSKDKDDLLAIVSHDLKNPLSVIESGMEHLLSDPEEKKKLGPVAGDLIRRSKNNARYAINLISDLLDLARLEGGMKLIYKNCNINELVAGCLDIVKPKLDEKRLRVSILGNKKYTVSVDESRLAQVIQNIVGNAIKFTPIQGKITITLDDMIDGQNQPWLQIDIADTGRGIPADKLESIFDKYQQAQAQDRETGTGLGLAICKNIAHLHGGDIKVKSKPGEGSTFSIILPLKQDAKEEGISDVLRDKKILVVDDNADILAIMTTKLSQKGSKVRTAQNGAKALEEINKDRPDIVLLDLEMPVLNGIDTIKHIREKYDRNELPVIIFSNKAQSETIEFFQIDVNDFANKREMMGQVFDKMAKVLEARIIKPSKELRILLVDDSEDIQALFKLFLKDQDMSLDIADGLKIAKQKIPQDGPYDLIFLDLNLADGQGLELMAPLRQWEKNQGIGATPVIAITGATGNLDNKALQNAGIGTVVSKSITKQKLISLIHDAIKS